MTSLQVESPLVSVIIPAHNYGRFLAQTLQSVLAQTYRNWECFVIDDGSTDDTREVAESFTVRDSRVRYRYQANQRAGAARNNGMRNCKGKYVQFLDADDLIESHKLARQVEFLEQRPDIDIVYGDARTFATADVLAGLSDEFGEESGWMPRISGSGKRALMSLIALPLLIHAPLLRLRVADSVIMFDETLRACEDWLFWVQCALEGRRFQYEPIEGTLAFYRTHATSACADRPLVDAETRRLRKVLNAVIHDADARRLNRRLAAEYEGGLAVQAVADGRTAKAVWQLVRAGIISPGYRTKAKWFLCAGLAPFASRNGFDALLAAPALDSLGAVMTRGRHRPYLRALQQEEG